MVQKIAMYLIFNIHMNLRMIKWIKYQITFSFHQKLCIQLWFKLFKLTRVATLPNQLLPPSFFARRLSRTLFIRDRPQIAFNPASNEVSQPGGRRHHSLRCPPTSTVSPTSTEAQKPSFAALISSNFNLNVETSDKKFYPRPRSKRGRCLRLICEEMPGNTIWRRRKKCELLYIYI